MNAGSIVERVTRPENCVLGFGIPTSKEKFDESGWYGPSGCFARRFRRDWYRYHAEVIEPYDRLGSRIRRLGARVVPDLTLDAYANLFRSPGVHAVILFTHWGDDFFEFRDGLAGVDAVAAAIPEDFIGVVDLCACHPNMGRLIPLLRGRLPDESFIHYIDAEATPIRWLYFYRDLFLLLRRGTMDYLAASTELIEAYFGKPQEIQP